MQGARLDAGRDNSHPPSSALIGSARKLWKIFATDRKILPTKKVRSRRERAGKCWRRAEPGCWQWSCNREKKKKGGPGGSLGASQTGRDQCENPSWQQDPDAWDGGRGVALMSPAKGSLALCGIHRHQPHPGLRSHPKAPKVGSPGSQGWGTALETPSNVARPWHSSDFAP